MSDPADRGNYKGVLDEPVPDPPERPPMLIPSRPLLGILGQPGARAAAGSSARGASAVGGSIIADSELDSPSDPLPTGPIPVVDDVAPVGFDPTSPARATLQAAVVGLAALLVGLVVFGAVRSAVTDDSELADPDHDLPTIDPGPGDPGSSDDRLGNERGTAELDGRTEDGEMGDADGVNDTTTDGVNDTTTGSDGTGDPDGTTDTNGDSRSSSSAGNPPPAGPSSSVTTVRPGTGGGLTPSGPTDTTRGQGTSVTSSPSNSSTSRPTNTASTATTRTSTTTSTSTTTTTTTRPPVDLPLIAAPSSGAMVTWESALTFRANPVSGATTYCWALDGLGGTVNRCSSSSTYRLDGSSRTPGPGPVTVVAEARDDAGSALRTHSITVILHARDVIASPAQGDSVSLGRPIRLTARNIPGATRYCWTLAQGTAATAPICATGRTVSIGRGSPDLDGFGAGPVNVRVVVERDGTQIGSDTVIAALTEAPGGGGNGGGGNGGGGSGSGGGDDGGDDANEGAGNDGNNDNNGNGNRGRQGRDR